MKTKLVKCLLTGMCGLFAACAVITVNVYFPEKAVKDAYKTLDDVLLKNEGDAASKGKGQPAPGPAAPQAGPQGRLFDALPSLSFVGVAQAADYNGEDLAIELGSMPEVAKAYAEMNQRLPRLTALFDSGVVWLTMQGLVTVRDKTRSNSQTDALVTAENQNRKTVISDMAKAILKITKQEATKANLDQTMGKAAASFADTRREAARPGWWIQLQNGRWVQK